MNVRFVALLAVAVFSSCVCAPAPCTKDSECSDGLRCNGGQCLAACTTASGSTCSAGSVCSDGYCRAECSSNAGCSGEQACAGGVCRPKACNGATCAQDNVCIDGQCTAAACAGVICPSGQACAGGTCVSTMCAGTQCGPGQVCINSVCSDAACVGVVCPANQTCLSGVCLSPGDPLPYSLVCDAMAQGYKKSFTQSAAFCRSAPAPEDDVAHQAFFSTSGSGNLTTRPTTGTLQYLWSFFTCGPVGPDAGFFSLALAPLDQSIDAGRIAYDGLKARACINAGIDGGSVSAACSQVFVPLVPEGAACARTEECANDHYCKPSALDTCAGTCAPRLPDSAVCEPSRDLCMSGTCAYDGTGYHCRPLTTSADGGSPVGSDCPAPGTTTTCAPNLRCVRNTSLPPQPDGGPTGTCTAAVGNGMPCGVSSALGAACTGNCITCYSTDGLTGVCRDKGTAGTTCRIDTDCADFHMCLNGQCTFLARPGEACVVASNGARGNCMWADNYCRQSAPDAGSGTCSTIPSLNQACGNRYDLTDVCSSGYCAQGTCQPEPRLGEACTSRCSGDLRCESRDAGPLQCWPLHTLNMSCFSTSDCESSLRCVSGACVARFAAGSVCTQDNDCLSNNCLDGAKVCAETCFSSFTAGQTFTPGCAGGLRDWAILLAYSSLAVVLGRRKRK